MVRKILGEMEKNKNILKLRVEGVVVTDRDENHWESNCAKGRFDLGKEDGGDELISDDCDQQHRAVFRLLIWEI